MTLVTRDFPYVWRRLFRAPGFMASAVLTLALGLGTNVAFFAMANALVFGPKRAADIDQVFLVGQVSPRSRHWSPGMTLSEFHDLAVRPPRGVVALAASQLREVTARNSDTAERISAEFVSGGFGDLLRLRPIAGRFITADDDQGVVVISERLWRERFGSRPDILGREVIRLNRAYFTIIGVAPRGFRGVQAPADLWLPLASATTALAPAEQGGPLTVLVRTDRAEPTGRIEASIDDVIGRVSARSETAWPIRLRPAEGWNQNARVTTVAVAVLALSGLVLLAACANLANLLHARGADRAGEMAIRLSLGASPGQLIRLLLAEVAVIATLAAVSALVFASATTRLYCAAFPTLYLKGITTLSLEATLDWRVLAYGLAAGAFAALVVGGATAWRSSRVDVQQMIAAGGASAPATRRGGLSTTLVAIQVTAAVVLLIGTGLFLRGLEPLFDRRLTFDTAHLATVRVDLSKHGYNESRGQAFLDRVLRDVRSAPGVDHAALTQGLPGGMYAKPLGATIFADKEHPVSDAPQTGWIDASYRHILGGFASVSPGFLGTLGLPLNRGRDFTVNDRQSAPLVAIVSEGVTALLWPGQDPLGRRLMIGNDGYWRTVVGVSADPAVVSENSPAFDLPRLVLVPYGQRYKGEMLILVSAATPTEALGAVRRAIRALDDEVAAFDASTVDASVLAWVNPMRAAAALLGSLGIIALGMAALGVYGVVGYSVRVRTREFGIRLALGATPRGINRMVVDEALHILLVGLLPGVLVASLLSRWIEHFAVGVIPNNIPTWIAVPVLILATGVIAAYFPALRAGRIDPNVALRDL